MKVSNNRKQTLKRFNTFQRQKCIRTRMKRHKMKNVPKKEVQGHKEPKNWIAWKR